jgi:hypothetical protein
VRSRPTATQTPEERRQLRLSLVASVVGTSIEWYDFFLYGTAASNHAGALAAFATCARRTST